MALHIFSLQVSLFQLHDFPISSSIYYPFVKDWKDVMGDNMAIFRSEDYFYDRIPTLQNITKFLNLGEWYFYKDQYYTGKLYYYLNPTNHRTMDCFC